MATFENPLNNHQVIVGTGGPFVGCLFFGAIYFLFKGNFKHCILSIVVAICTLGVGWFIYPFFAPGIIRNMYLEKGYRQIKN